MNSIFSLIFIKIFCYKIILIIYIEVKVMLNTVLGHAEDDMLDTYGGVCIPCYKQASEELESDISES